MKSSKQFGRFFAVALGLAVSGAVGAAMAEKTMYSDTAPANAAAQNGGQKLNYHVARVLDIGGEGRWDYIVIDPATKLLFVPRQTHTQIVQAADGKVVHDIADTAGCHGVALVPEFNRGFISDGTANQITVFDLKTFDVLGPLPADKKPDAIVYDPASQCVFAFNGKSDDVTAIHTNYDFNLKRTAVEKIDIPLGGKPEFAAADWKGKVFVNLEDKSQVAVIDTKAMKVIDHWKIEGGESPSGMAIDPIEHHLFIGCHSQVMAIIDSETGKTLGTVPIGKGIDACAFDPGTKLAFASCGDGTVTAVAETAAGKFDVQQTIKTVPGARTMCVDPVTHILYLPAMVPDKDGQASSFGIVVVEP